MPRVGRGLEIPNPASSSPDCLSELSAATKGSAGVDLAVARTVTITDGQVTVVESTVSGPLGFGLSALLIGRSSSSRQGIFVLPGLIDADYIGPIGIMVKVFAPPVTINQGSRIAQLIPFRAQVPVTNDKMRGTGAFGSTGDMAGPLVMFNTILGADRPNHPTIIMRGTKKLSEEPMQMMMDTGADVTILPISAWPSEWPLKHVNIVVSGIGGESKSLQRSNAPWEPRTLTDESKQALKVIEQKVSQQQVYRYDSQLPIQVAVYGPEGSSTGQGIVERRHQDIKRLLRSLKKEGEISLSPQDMIAKACYVLNWKNPVAIDEKRDEYPTQLHFVTHDTKIQAQVQTWDPKREQWRKTPETLLTWGRGLDAPPRQVTVRLKERGRFWGEVKAKVEGLSDGADAGAGPVVSDVQPVPSRVPASDPVGPTGQDKAGAAASSEGLQAFPVLQGATHNTYQPLAWQALTELRGAVGKYGLGSAEVMQVLRYFNASLLTPFDIRSLAQALFPPVEYDFFEHKWTQLAVRAVERNTTLGPGDPRRMVNTDMLMGTGNYTRADGQAGYEPLVQEQCQQTGMAALVQTIQLATAQESFATIVQGVDEPFLCFAGWLTAAMEKQVSDPAARKLMLQFLA
ncbi:hypothetical protein DUI87_02302 [Hirundo rustica rustica]|uniref:Peptidase A2 domain-containing protein n=1 Tax=Hirundo rustica rustica TaxID=333673 RepID=A0A3M0L8W2_HIRRU|nr:hypothetical protein DUI87_02302 [Hirundo rustica rustica]